MVKPERLQDFFQGDLSVRNRADDLGQSSGLVELCHLVLLDLRWVLAWSLDFEGEEATTTAAHDVRDSGSLERRAVNLEVPDFFRLQPSGNRVDDGSLGWHSLTIKK